MVSKLLTRSILAVSLVFFMGTTAGATIGGISTTQKTCTLAQLLAKLCSIEVEGLLKGLGNVTNTPTAFSVTVSIQAGKIYCVGPAGPEDGGVPFIANLRVEVSGADTIDSGQITRNGKAVSEIVFHDDQMIQALIDAGSVAAEQIQCDAGSGQVILVTKMEVLGRQWTDTSTSNSCNLIDNPLTEANEITITNQCTLVDALGTQCFSPIAANPEQQAALDQSLIFQAFTYDCLTFCHDKDKTQEACPAPGF